MEVCIGGSKGNAGSQPIVYVFHATEKRRETEKLNPGVLNFWKSESNFCKINRSLNPTAGIFKLNLCFIQNHLQMELKC